ncbi:hypothetical protein PAXINDRAFT_31816, partial [Paxillus involutus ATCC 200175]
MRDRKISLLALQETHLTKSEEDSLNSVFHEKLHIVSSIDTTHPNAKGVALVWNKMTTNTHGIVSHEIVPGRALLATVPWHREERMTILVVYAPNDPTHIREFWETIKIELGNLPKPDVILGDFNLVEDALDRLPPHLDPLSASEPLQDLKRSLKLTDGWRRENPDSISFTFAQSAAQGGSQSRIDRIYVRDDWLPFSKEWEIDPPGIHTDHQLVSVRLSTPRMPFIGKGRWTLPIFILQDNTVKEEIIRLGTDLQKRLNDCNTVRSEGDNPQIHFRNFKDAVSWVCRSEAKKAVPKIQKTIESLKRTLKEVLEDGNLDEEDKRLTS